MVDDHTRHGATLDPPRFFGRRAWYRRRLESLEAQTVLDDLTGLRNQRALWRELDRRTASCSESAPLAVVMLDFDFFSEVNEGYGHPVGDAVLRSGASVLRESAPSPRLAFRYGGEEFVLLLPGDEEAGRAVAEELRVRISTPDGHLPSVTVSCGVAALYIPVEPWVALDRADAALRDAKRAGRNRVVVAGSTPATRAVRLLEEPDHEAPRRAALALAVATLTAPGDEDPEAAEDVLTLCEAVGRQLAFKGVALDQLLAAAQLHDLGKVAVAPEVLNRPGPLTDDERAVVAEHTVIGERILRSVPEMAEVATIVRHSHEHWDGSGYPDGLAGEEIPLASRVILCANAFHAIRTDRPYRRGRPAAEAIAELRACAGTQFDPAVVAAFVELGDSLRRQQADPAVVTALPRSRRLVSLLLALVIATGTAYAAIPEVRDLIRALFGTSIPRTIDIVPQDEGFSLGPLGDILSIEPTLVLPPGEGRPGDAGAAEPELVSLSVAVRRRSAGGGPAPPPLPVFGPDDRGTAPTRGGGQPGEPGPPAPDAPETGGGDTPSAGPVPVGTPPDTGAPSPDTGLGPGADPPASDPEPGPAPAPDPGTEPASPPGSDDPVPRDPEEIPSRDDEAGEGSPPGRPDNPGREDPPALGQSGDD